MVGIYLNESGSSVVQVVLVLAVGMVIPLVLSRTVWWHRALLFAVGGVLTVRYIWWRATDTIAPFGLTWDCLASWSFLLVEAGAALSSLSAFLILSRTKDRRSPCS
jgi:cellulose synthase (UDP-forming)